MDFFIFFRNNNLNFLNQSICIFIFMKKKNKINKNIKKKENFFFSNQKNG